MPAPNLWTVGDWINSTAHFTQGVIFKDLNGRIAIMNVYGRGAGRKLDVEDYIFGVDRHEWTGIIFRF